MRAYDKVVLCGANAYEQKYYFNDEFCMIPESVQEELHIIAVLFTEEVGGVFLMTFDEEGNLEFETQSEEGDLLYDDIGAGLLIRKIKDTRRDLLESLSLYYRILFMGEDPGELLQGEE